MVEMVNAVGDGSSNGMDNLSPVSSIGSTGSVTPTGAVTPPSNPGSNPPASPISPHWNK